MTEHRIEFLKRLKAFGNDGLGDTEGLRRIRNLLLALRQELVQRRIQKSDHDRKARHDLEQFDEVGSLDRQQTIESGATPFFVAGHDHLAHDSDALAFEEHMLRSAQSDSLGPEGSSGSRFRRGLGVRPNPHAACTIRHRHQGRKVARQGRAAKPRRSGDDVAGGTVDCEGIAKLKGPPSRDQSLAVLRDAQRSGTGDAWLADTARDNCSMTCRAAPDRQHAFGHVHAVHVLRNRLVTHQYRAASFRRQRDGLLSREDDGACGRSRRCRHASGEDVRFLTSFDGRMKQFVERRRVDTKKGLFFRQDVFAGHLDGNPDRLADRAFCRPRLEEEELAVADHEVDLGRVTEMLLDPTDVIRQGGKVAWKPLPAVARQLCEIERVREYTDGLADTPSTERELAGQPRLARLQIARHGPSGSRLLATLVEDHRMDGDRQSGVFGDPVDHAKGSCNGISPTCKSRLDDIVELLQGSLRERSAAFVFNEFEIGDDQRTPVDDRVRFRTDPTGSVPLPIRHIVEFTGIETMHERAIALDEPTVGTECKPEISEFARQTLDRSRIQSDI
ncbi:hypothetical protein GGQ76_000962 [Aureimonas jatrophae]|nr:hypothetical protein [Aureimonas jatrophae]